MLNSFEESISLTCQNSQWTKTREMMGLLMKALIWKAPRKCTEYKLNKRRTTLILWVAQIKEKKFSLQTSRRQKLTSLILQCMVSNKPHMRSQLKTK